VRNIVCLGLMLIMNRRVWSFALLTLFNKEATLFSFKRLPEGVGRLQR
jgi:hypothetical protein